MKVQDVIVRVCFMNEPISFYDDLVAAILMQVEVVRRQCRDEARMCGQVVRPIVEGGYDVIAAAVGLAEC